MHYTDINDVKLAMADMKERNNIERESFKTDSEYVLNKLSKSPTSLELHLSNCQQ
jgi:hypothetical protein